MATPQTAQAQVIDIPVLGMDTRDPLLKMEPLYSPWLENVDTDGQKLSVRNGFDYFGTVISQADVILGLGVYGDPTASNAKLYAYTQGEGDGSSVKNKIMLGAGDGTFSVAYTTSHYQADEAYPVNFKTQLGFNVEAAPNFCSARYDGSSWSTMGFTYSAYDIAAYSACAYKGRVYLWNPPYLYYSALNAVTGACTRRDLGDLFKYKTSLGGFIEVLSSPGDRPSETYLAIGNSAGEILVYGGDYPDSTTWALVGQYHVPRLAGSRSTLVINNDVWIATIGGIISLRALMSNGAEAFQSLSPTYMIQTYWTTLIGTIPAPFSGFTTLSMAYWPEKNKVYVFVPAYVSINAGATTTGSGTILVYDISSNGWTIHRVPQTIFCSATDLHTTLGGLTYYQNNLYFYCGPNVYRYSSDYMDDNDPTVGGQSAFSWFIKSNHSTLGNATTRKIVKGWAPLLKADHCSGDVRLYHEIDVGRISTAVTSAAPAIQDGINALTIMHGGVGTVFQWSLIGQTNASITGPLELYSMGVIL